MTVDFDLPLIKVKGVTYSDEAFRYNGYRLDAWRGDISKFDEHFKIAEDLFFQTEMSINKDLLSELNLDLENTTYALANLLFDNLEKASNLQKQLDCRFDEIEDGLTNYNEPVVYIVDGTEYITYYLNELLAEAREFYEEYISDSSISDVIGGPEYLKEYFDVINVRDLATEVRKEIVDRDQVDYMDEDTYNDDKKVIMWLAETDTEGEMFIWQMLEEEKLFDYIKYAEQSIVDDSDAIDQLNSMIGDHIYTGQVVLDGWKPSKVYIFERY